MQAILALPGLPKIIQRFSNEEDLVNEFEGYVERHEPEVNNFIQAAQLVTAVGDGSSKWTTTFVSWADIITTFGTPRILLLLSLSLSLSFNLANVLIQLEKIILLFFPLFTKKSTRVHHFFASDFFSLIFENQAAV